MILVKRKDLRAISIFPFNRKTEFIYCHKGESTRYTTVVSRMEQLENPVLFKKFLNDFSTATELVDSLPVKEHMESLRKGVFICHSAASRVSPNESERFNHEIDVQWLHKCVAHCVNVIARFLGGGELCAFASLEEKLIHLKIKYRDNHDYYNVMSSMFKVEYLAHDIRCDTVHLLSLSNGFIALLLDFIQRV